MAGLVVAHPFLLQFDVKKNPYYDDEAALFLYGYYSSKKSCRTVRVDENVNGLKEAMK